MKSNNHCIRAKEQSRETETQIKSEVSVILPHISFFLLWFQIAVSGLYYSALKKNQKSNNHSVIVPTYKYKFGTANIKLGYVMQEINFVATRAGEPEPEPELGAPEPSIFLGAGVGAGAVIWICCGAGAGAGAINETISSGSEWFKILTKPSLQFLAQKDHLVC